MSLLFRDFEGKDVCPVICDIKANRSFKWVDWVSTGFKCGRSYQEPTFFPGGNLAVTKKAISMIANSTAISQVFQRMKK